MVVVVSEWDKNKSPSREAESAEESEEVLEVESLLRRRVREKPGNWRMAFEWVSCLRAAFALRLMAGL